MTNNRVINLSVGWTFILLGVAGAVLPVLQGFLFFVVGLLFLSKEYHWAHRLLLWLKDFMHRRIPKAATVFQTAEDYLEREVHNLTTIPGYFRKKVWLLIGLILAIAVIGSGFSLLIAWLWGLIFG